MPGVRFVVNATLGIAKYPYPEFLLWSAIGGALWSDYTCVLAYAVGTALDNFPLASVIISGVITTSLMGVIFWRVKRQRQAQQADRDRTYRAPERRVPAARGRVAQPPERGSPARKRRTAPPGLIGGEGGGRSSGSGEVGAVLLA